MKTEILCARDISKTSDIETPLRLFNFNICAREVLGIIGLNTSGVSTLMDVLTGFKDIDSGSFYVNSQPVLLGTIENARMRGIFRIRTVSAIFPKLSVKDNIGILSGHSYSNWPKAKRMIQVFARELFHKYGIKLSLDQKVEELTNYEKNIIEIICAIVCKAKIIVLDNVIGRYTDKEFFGLMMLINRIKFSGTAFIIADTRIETITSIADRIFVMRSGLIGRVFYRGEYDEDTIYKTLTSDYPKANRLREFDQRNPVILKAEHFTIPGKAEDLDFTVKRGEAVAFIKKNGNPFYDIMYALSGEIGAGGELFFCGKKLMPMCEKDLLALGIGKLNGDFSKQIFPELTLAENLMLMIYGDYKWPHSIILKRRMIRFVVHEYARKLNIDPRLLSKPLKKFNDQSIPLIVMMRWVIAEPKLLLIDNLFMHCDVIVRDEIVRYIQMLKDNGTAILFCSQVNSEINQLCDRIYKI